VSSRETGPEKLKRALSTVLDATIARKNAWF
jgi:hypothetical protein